MPGQPPPPHLRAGCPGYPPSRGPRGPLRPPAGRPAPLRGFSWCWPRSWRCPFRPRRRARWSAISARATIRTPTSTPPWRNDSQPVRTRAATRSAVSKSRHRTAIRSRCPFAGSSSFPGSTCTALTAPGTFASGTLVFTAPADATLSSGTTYTVVATPAGTTLRLDATTADAEDTGGATGWSLADEYDWRNSSNMWTTNVTNKSLRVAIKGPTVQVPAAVSDVVVVPVPRPPTRCKSPGPLPMTRGGIT